MTSINSCRYCCTTLTSEAPRSVWVCSSCQKAFDAGAASKDLEIDRLRAVLKDEGAEVRACVHPKGCTLSLIHISEPTRPY